MISRIHTVAFQGIEAISILIEAQISPGLPAFNIVGLPNKSIAESRERIRASFYSMGLSFPPRRITINLAPADIQKEGSHYDLPIALALLASMGVTDVPLEEYIALGELGLDGSINNVYGVLPAALKASENSQTLICPSVCGQEASWAGSLEILAPNHLLQLLNHFKGSQILSPPSAEEVKKQSVVSLGMDMIDVKGQASVKRALEVAAAGSHHVLMIGPPGAGKSMLAKRFSTILPAMTASEVLETTMIHSLAGLLPEEGLIKTRPYRDPHHTSSHVAIIGGGMRAKPGEISLAHGGVLFLDEIAEFQRQTLESLRQPLETGDITVARANHHVKYPARFQLIAAMNPCKCGFYMNINQQCSKAPDCAFDYQNKISGPLMDRFDIVIPVRSLKPSEIFTRDGTGSTDESSSAIAERVAAARAKQLRRYQSVIGVSLNSHLQGKSIEQMIPLIPEAEKLLLQAAEKMRLSARGFHRVIKVARSIADLEGNEQVNLNHVGEALNYRQTMKSLSGSSV